MMVMDGYDCQTFICLVNCGQIKITSIFLNWGRFNLGTREANSQRQWARPYGEGDKLREELETSKRERWKEGRPHDCIRASVFAFCGARPKAVKGSALYSQQRRFTTWGAGGLEDTQTIIIIKQLKQTKTKRRGGPKKKKRENGPHQICHVGAHKVDRVFGPCALGKRQPPQ